MPAILLLSHIHPFEKYKRLFECMMYLDQLALMFVIRLTCLPDMQFVRQLYLLPHVQHTNAIAAIDIVDIINYTVRFKCGMNDERSSVQQSKIAKSEKK